MVSGKHSYTLCACVGTTTVEVADSETSASLSTGWSARIRRPVSRGRGTSTPVPVPRITARPKAARRATAASVEAVAAVAAAEGKEAPRAPTAAQAAHEASVADPGGDNRARARSSRTLGTADGETHAPAYMQETWRMCSVPSRRALRETQRGRGNRPRDLGTAYLWSRPRCAQIPMVREVAFVNSPEGGEARRPALQSRACRR